MKFRPLRADEIEARVARINGGGCFLLLYKDSRADMNLLDETVGTMNWKREHCRDNRNCIVSIWDEDKRQWVSKEDTGTESNTEAQKGLASDSFKRACVNWGIGRELYTSPVIVFKKGEYNDKDGKTYDRFKVADIRYENGSIKEVTILNVSKGIRKTFANDVKVSGEKIKPKEAELLRKLVEDSVFKPADVLAKYHADTFDDLTPEQYADALRILKKHGKGEDGEQGKTG